MNKSSHARPTIFPATREEWRAWLEENHAVAPFIWLVYNKKSSGISGLTYEEAVEEALCFGWIDSTTNKYDDTRTMQYFAPRKPKSVWARSNKERVERLIAEGQMTPAGMAKIEAAKLDGSWSAMDDIDALVMPEDLRSALAEDLQAEQNFAAFSPSSRKQILYWIAEAKRPETRAKRVEETVRLASENKKARG